jgi:hypothetical protein
MSLHSSDGPRVAALLATLRGNRKRISLTYLGSLAGIPPGQLWRYLQLRHVRDAMKRRGWTFTDSKALGLPALEAFPFSVPYLVRN